MGVYSFNLISSFFLTCVVMGLWDGGFDFLITIKFKCVIQLPLSLAQMKSV